MAGAYDCGLGSMPCADALLCGVATAKVRTRLMTSVFTLLHILLSIFM